MIQVNRIYLIFNRLVTKKFLVDTSALVCLIILIISSLSLFIGYYCAILKDRYSIQKKQTSYLQIYNALLTTRSQCEKLQNTLQQNKPKFWQSPYYFTVLQKNECNITKSPYLPPIIAINKCLEAFSIVEQGLKTIQGRLKLSQPEPNNQYRKAPLFLYLGISIIGLLLTVQVLTALLCLFLFGTISVSLIAGSISSNAYIYKLSSVLFQYCNINIGYLFSSLTCETYTDLETIIWIIVATLFIVLSISLIKRIIRLIISQCEILFMGCRISISILLTNLTKAQITEELEQMSQNIQLKNSSSHIGKILHRIFD